MRVMWVCNVPTPEASRVFEIEETPIEGWLVEVANELSHLNSIELYLLFHSSKLKKRCSYKKGKKIIYIAINNSTMTLEDQVDNFRNVINEVTPDLIHVWGTESIHSYALTEAAKQEGLISRVVLSLQGLVSMYAYHYFAGIPWKTQIIPTIRDIFRKDSIISQQRRFISKGKYEKKAIRNVKHVIGRTFWDKAAVTLMNPDLEYHFNNETLRASFYQKEWDYSRCQKHSIFVSQAQYPIKGFHYVLESLRLLVPLYPDIKLYVSGSDNVFKPSYKIGAYGKYIQSLIKKNKLEGHVIYVGMLKEEQMRDQYLKCEVFVSCSVIENSPNSVGEAMLLGMPVISSNVGGVSDLLHHGTEGYLYQADAPYMLAYYIQRIFNNPKLASELGKNARIHALMTHNKIENIRRLQEIYYEIYDGE